MHYENTKRLWLFAFSNADLNELWSSCVAADGLGLFSLHLQFFTAVISTQKATDVSILQDDNDLKFTKVEYYVPHLLVPFAGNCFMSSEEEDSVVTASLPG